VLKTIGNKVLELVVTTIFAALLSVFVLLSVSSSSETLVFQSSGSSAVAVASIEPAWGDGVEVRLSAIGMSVYSGSMPRVDIKVTIAGEVVATNLGSDEDKISSDYCEVVSNPSLARQVTGTVVTTEVSCAVPLSKLPKSSKRFVPIAVLMTLRGDSTNTGGPPSVNASGSYSISGGLFHRFFARMAGR